MKYYPLNAYRMCIHSKDEPISGEIYSPLCDAPVSFAGLSFVIQMDKVFDDNGYPQAFQEKRTFLLHKKRTNQYKGRPVAKTDSKTILAKEGTVATFDIVVTSRYNTSWQGDLYDVTGQKLGQFHGEMELIHKINELLTTK